VELPANIQSSSINRRT